MNAFDFAILRWLTSWANRWPWFDGLVAFSTNWELVKGGFALSLYWWAWFRKGSQQREQRARLLAALAAAMGALAIASVLALALPYRPRPRILVGMDAELSPGWAEWSAFPSDHATLFFALATGLWMVARPLGLIALVHTVAVVCFPRVYLGLHYPTDILGGTVIGVASVLLVDRSRFVLRNMCRVAAAAGRHPSVFYALGFLATYLLATLFGDLRRAGNTFVTWWLR
ncbi:MAG: phosphatase PAP2 family protein [Candidatus Binatia bacterium]|nr:phosphatase PAP2 family protein [Candidatus Binatia bacterium]